MLGHTRISRLLPHLVTILAGMQITLYTIDRFNSAMRFFDSDITKGLILALSLSAVAVAWMLVMRQRRDDLAQPAAEQVSQS